jgi:protein involved in polysaccharide export with SLBB domain
MNFDQHFVSIRAFALWCKRCLGLALLGLLIACGGGGGGSSTTAEAPTLSLTNASSNLAPFYPGNEVFLLPTYTSGTGKITWLDNAGATQTRFIDKSGTLVQINPLVTTVYTLTVTYQDPTQVRTNLLTKTESLTVTITPVATPPVAFDLGGDMTVARSDHASILLPDGRVLVMGGTDSVNVLKSSELFDPSTETWRASGDMKAARRGHSATLLADGKVLVTGGFDGKAALATAEIYDPSTGVWTATLGPMVSSRRFHSAILLNDGKVLIAGGVVGPLVTADPKATELYNPATGLFTAYATFTETAAGSGVGTGLALPEARQGHTATKLSTGHVLFVGNSGVNSAVAKLLVYDSATPTASTWTLAGTMTNTRYNHAAAVLNDNNVLITGGFGNQTGTSKSVEIYNPTSNAWSSGASMSTDRALHTSTKLQDGRVLVVGGYDGLKALTTVEIYDPSANTWTATSASKVLNTARAMHTSSLLSSGDVLIVGTYFQTSGTISKTTEIWRR